MGSDSVRRTRRPLRAAAAAVLVAAALAGCQGLGAHGFTRNQAQADASSAMRQALAAIPNSHTAPETNSPIRCSTDDGYFTTKWEWRMLTLVTPTVDRGAVFAAVEKSFTQAWRSHTSGSADLGFTLTLTGPKRSGGHAQVRVVGAPHTADLTIAVTSACYDG